MPNAKVLETKKATVAAMSEQIKGATAGVFVDYKGITVEQDTKLRNEFRAAGVEYTVVKNTLTRLAARDCGYDFDEVLNGTTSFAVTTGDPIAPARIVSQFAKQNKVLAIKGGFVEGKMVSAEELNAFGELTSKNDLVAQVLGTLLAPISSLAFVLDQVRLQKAGPEEEAAPAAE
jgi:large subunit ribosomal protein L10